MAKKVKDKRYNALKQWINSGEVKTFLDIFDIIPKTQVAKDSGIHYNRLNVKINNPVKFTVKDIVTLAELLEVDDRKLYELIRPVDRRKK